jgi:hypothetical protein
VLLSPFCLKLLSKLGSSLPGHVLIHGPPVGDCFISLDSVSYPLLHYCNFFLLFLLFYLSYMLLSSVYYDFFFHLYYSQGSGKTTLCKAVAKIMQEHHQTLAHMYITDDLISFFFPYL